MRAAFMSPTQAIEPPADERHHEGGCAGLAQPPPPLALAIEARGAEEESQLFQ